VYPGRGRGPRRFGPYGSGGRARGDFTRDIHPPEFRDKIDPRSPVTYIDLDKPPEDNFELDYEKALAAFAAGGQ